MKCKFCNSLLERETKGSDWFSCNTCDVSFLLEDDKISVVSFRASFDGKLCILHLRYIANDSLLLVFDLKENKRYSLPLLDNITPTNLVSKIQAILVFS